MGGSKEDQGNQEINEKEFKQQRRQDILCMLAGGLICYLAMVASARFSIYHNNLGANNAQELMGEAMCFLGPMAFVAGVKVGLVASRSFLYIKKNKE